jgi:hypothetical protein
MIFKPTPPKPAFEFEAIVGWEDQRKRWYWSFAVSNPRDCMDFSHLKGKMVKIDGNEYTVANVDAPIHPAPWRKGERVSLGVNQV